MRLLLCIALSLASAIAVSSDVFSNRTGSIIVPDDGFAADAPVFGNCTLCHNTFEVQTGDGDLWIEGIPSEYVPGQTYTLTVYQEQVGQARWGFELTATHRNLSNAGQFLITDASLTQATNTFGRNYVKHTDPGSYLGVVDGPVSWTFDWIAPPAGSGRVFFYVAGTAANGDFTPFNDYTYIYATASAESGGSHSIASLVVQPNNVNIARGEVLRIWAHVQDHTTTTQSLWVASRAKLPNGQYLPSSGYLSPPLNVSQIPGQQETAYFEYTIPVNAGLITMDFETYLGSLPGPQLIDTDSFVLSILP